GAGRPRGPFQHPERASAPAITEGRSLERLRRREAVDHGGGAEEGEVALAAQLAVVSVAVVSVPAGTRPPSALSAASVAGGAALGGTPPVRSSAMRIS